VPGGGSAEVLEGSEGLEREDDSLSLATVQIGEQIKRRHGRYLSPRALRHLEPAVAAGVPVALAVDLAAAWRAGESPWAFCDRCIGDWQAILGWARVMGLARQRGEHHGLAEELVLSVRRYGRPEHVEWAFGEQGQGETPAKP
jgi:hypothetical protein